MSTKKSVLLTDHTVAIMQACTDKRNPDNSIAWSNLINRSIIVNDFLFRESLPDFSVEEWQAILNTYTGCYGILEHPPFRVASDMMDNRGLINVDDHPDTELVIRIHAMSQAEQFAILSFVERFWCNDWDHVEDFNEVIETIKTAYGVMVVTR